MRNVGLGHTRQTNTLHGRAPLIINRSQYMCRCLEVVVDMPRLGIGPSSLTGHQAAAKVLLQIVLKAQVHASVSRFIASTKHVHMHTRTTSSRQAQIISAVRAVPAEEDGHEPRLGIGPSSKATRPW